MKWYKNIIKNVIFDLYTVCSLSFLDFFLKLCLRRVVACKKVLQQNEIFFYAARLVTTFILLFL